MLALAGATEAAAKAPKAKITRSAGGTPTIEAKNWKGIGFGYGYAFAQDNICTIADTYLTSAAERSRWFGPDAETPEGFSNLDSDLFYQQVRDRGIVEELIAQPPPAGPKAAVEQGVAGYVKGYNRYLAETGVENIPDSRCAGEPWVRPITKWDVYRRFYELVLYASSGVAIDGIAGAQPPAAAPRPAAYARAEAATDEVTAGRARAGRRARRGARPLGRHRLQRLGPGQRRDRLRRRDRARQPALPLGRPAALLSVPPRDPGQGQRLRGEPVRRPADPDRPHREARLEPHGLDRVPLHALRAHPGAGRPDQLPGRRRAGGDGGRRGHGRGQAARRLDRSPRAGPCTGPATGR